MQIDQEAPVEPKLMKEIIQKEVNKATQNLTKEIKTLKTALNLKNSPRDQPSAGTKKKGNQKKGAGGNNKDSSKDKTKTKKNPSAKSSTKKKKNSRSKKGKSHRNGRSS